MYPEEMKIESYERESDYDSKNENTGLENDKLQFLSSSRSQSNS